MSKNFSNFFKSMPNFEPNESEISDFDSKFEPKFIKMKPIGQFSSKLVSKTEDEDQQNVLRNVKNEPEQDFVIEIPGKLANVPTKHPIFLQNSAKSVEKSSKRIQNSSKDPKNSEKKQPKPRSCSKLRNKILSENINECKFCDNVYPDNGYIFDHLKRVHRNEIKDFILNCNLCNGTFFFKQFLDIHMKTKHKNGQTESFVCDLDAKIFKKKTDLRQHMRSHQQKISCKICNAKLKVMCLSSHMKVHDLKKNFKCKLCEKSFRNAQNLKRHERIHDKKLECKVCDKKYAHKKELIRHQKHFHEDLKTETCEICGKKFADKTNLNQHLPTHDKNRPKPFKCERCGHSATTKQRFKNHMKFHENQDEKFAAMINPKKCAQCPMLCKDNFALYIHRRNVHTEIIHQCDLCGNYYKNRTCLVQHMRSSHRKKYKCDKIHSQA